MTHDSTVQCPNYRHRVRALVALGATAALVLLTCGSEPLAPTVGTGARGELAARLLFKKATPVTHIPSEVKTVEICLSGADYDSCARFSYSAGEAEIWQVPVGMVAVVVNGLDVKGDTIYTGDTTVQIRKGELTEPAITLESTRPIVFMIMSPQRNEVVGYRSVTISGLIDAEYGLLTFRMNDGEVPVEGGLWSRTVTLGDGANRFAFAAYDRKGNNIADTLWVTYDENALDTTGPVLTVTQPEEGATLSAAQVTVHGTVSDISGVLSVSVNGRTVQLSGGAWSADVALEEGVNRIRLEAVDNNAVPNVTRDTIAVTYDPTAGDAAPPYLTVDSPDDGDTVTVPSVTVSGTVSDAGGVAWVKVNGAVASLAGLTWSRTVTLAQGANTIAVEAADASTAANRAADTVRVVYDPTANDNTPPKVAISSPTNNAVLSNASGVVVTGTASDGSGIASVTVNGVSASYAQGTWSVSIDLAAPGNNRVTAVARDPRGNTDSASVNLVYDPSAADITPPALSLVSHTAGATVSNASVLLQVSATDANGVALVTIAGGTATLNAGKYERSVTLALGVNNLTAVAADASSNANRDTLRFTLVYDPTASDATPPSVTLVSHTSGQTVSNATVLVQVTATDANGIAAVTIAGGAATLNAGRYERSVTLAQGVNNLSAVAVDASSRANRDTLRFTLTYDPTANDVTLPTILLVSHTSGQTVSNATVLVQVTASDANGISSVTIAGGSATLNAGKYERNVTLAQGANNLEAVATDASSNANRATLKFTLNYDPTAADVTPPAITLVSHASGQTVTDSSVLVQVTATDANGIAAVTIQGAPATLNGGRYERWVTLARGVNNLIAVAADASSNGNRDTLRFTLTFEPPSTAPKGMVLIPAAGRSFQMGSTVGAIEQPVHTVSFSRDFWMDSTEVTQADFQALMGQTPSYFTGKPGNPVEQVTWYDAVLYCNKRSTRDGLDTVYRYTGVTGTPGNGCTALAGITIDYTKNGYRLPTEAEWEYACRAGSTTDYYWGKNYNPYPSTKADSTEVGSYAVWRGNSFNLGSGSLAYGTHAVATTQPNAYGLYDMSGNVWEWCGDWYGGYASGAQSDPTGAGSGSNRVVRGGSWCGSASDLRSANRGYGTPDARNNRFGFRACLRAQ